MNKEKNKLILKASAGTGKTYTLSLKYIIALYKGIDYKNILVMTFTKKATAEIKEKILERMEELLFSKDNSTLIQNLIDNDEEKNKSLFENFNEIKLEKLKVIYSDMQKNKDKIKIYTIDSFMNIIFKNIVSKYKNFTKFSTLNGDENNIQSNRQKEINDDFYYKKILEEVFKNKSLFEDFKDFLMDNSEKDISKYLSVIKELIENRWKYLIAKEKDSNFFDRKKLEVKTPDYKILNEIFEFVSKDCEKEFSKIFKKGGKSLEKIFALIDDENFEIEYELKKEIKTNRLTYFKENPISLVGLKKDEKEYVNNLFKKFQENLAKEIYNEEILSYENKLLNFSEQIFKIYDNLKFKEKKFSFTDITLYSYMTIFDKNNLLLDTDNKNKTCGVSNLFFEMLDINIDAIFIDEFQDTSVLQWKILNEIIKKTNIVICVGDEKQSIYGWRGGEKRLFENLKPIIDAKEKSLNISYRSDGNIIKYVNSIFLKTSKNYSNWNYIECNYASQKNGYVNFSYIEKLKEKAINEKGKESENTDEYNNRCYSYLVNQIKKLNLKSYDDIAIIGRKKKNLKGISTLLEEENIPYTLYEEENIYENPAIFEFFEFLKYLLLDDELAFFNFVSSDIGKFYNINLAEIEILLKNKNNFLSFLKNSTSNLEFTDENYLDKTLNKVSLQNIYTFLKQIKKFKIKKSDKNISAREFVYNILMDFSFIDIFNSDNNLKNIFEIHLLSKNFNNIFEFFEAYQKGNLSFTNKISREKSKGIELMTIHKSKGLQFKTVFYLELLKSKRIPPKEYEKLEFLFNMDSTYEEIEFSLFFKKKYKSVLNLCFPEIFSDYDNKLEEEEINNKYVALTRAKNNLFYISQISEDVDLNEIPENLEENIFKDDLEKENLIPIISNDEKINLKKELIELDLVNENYKFEEEINDSKFLLETEEKRKLGILIHYFLENIKFSTEEEIKFSKKLCYKNYVSYFGKDKLDKIFSEKNMKEIFEKDKEIFSEKWDYIFSEYELYDKESKNKFRLDRLMIKDQKTNGDKILEKGEVYIIDYKTGQKNDEQLENYKNLLLKNFPELKNYNFRTKFIEFNIIY